MQQFINGKLEGSLSEEQLAGGDNFANIKKDIVEMKDFTNETLQASAAEIEVSLMNQIEKIKEEQERQARWKSEN